MAASRRVASTHRSSTQNLLDEPVEDRGVTESSAPHHQPPLLPPLSPFRGAADKWALDSSVPPFSWVGGPAHRANFKPTCRAQRPGSSGCSRPDASIGALARGRGNNPISDTCDDNVEIETAEGSGAAAEDLERLGHADRGTLRDAFRCVAGQHAPGRHTLPA